MLCMQTISTVELWIISLLLKVEINNIVMIKSIITIVLCDKHTVLFYVM